MSKRVTCPLCGSYLLDHPNPKLPGWKKCNCGYACDKDGKNKLSKETPKKGDK